MRIKIAGAFIAAVILFSMFSRTRRKTELRFEKFDFVDDHSRFLWDALLKRTAGWFGRCSRRGVDSEL